VQIKRESSALQGSAWNIIKPNKYYQNLIREPNVTFHTKLARGGATVLSPRAAMATPPYGEFSTGCSPETSHRNSVDSARYRAATVIGGGESKAVFSDF